MTPEPIGGGEFAALMARLGPFPTDRRVVAGVSGGADSMAMALLLSRWGQPFACIVDHGLRPESAREAADTMQRLSALSIPARVMQASIAPGAGLSARARYARYKLLTQACAEIGCPDLLVAHHAADQAETVMLRRDRGSGAAGLAGMASITHLDAARLLRPLLGIAPDRLRATLRQAGVAWAEDPGNADPSSPRARLRLAMTAADTASLAASAAAHGRQRRLDEAGIAETLADVELYPDGTAVVPQAIGAAALASLIWCLSGRDYPPSPGSLAAGLAPRTLHGVMIAPAGRLGPGWLLTREPASVAGPIPALDGARWDGRFVVDGAPPGAMLGALGPDAARVRRRDGPPALVLRGLPALRLGGELYAVPHLGFPDAAACRSLALRFAPPHRAAGAPFVWE